MNCCLKFDAVRPSALDIPKDSFQRLPVCWAWICRELTEHSNCRSKVRTRADHKVHQTANSISIRHTGHSVAVLASSFAHGLGKLESWILRRSDGFAVLHNKLYQNIACELDLPHR